MQKTGVLARECARFFMSPVEIEMAGMIFTVPLLLAAQGLAVSGVPVYFPASLSEQIPQCRHQGKVRSAAQLSVFEREWYSRFLYAAKEPSLAEMAGTGNASGSVIRFTWLRSFHAPVVVRVMGLGTAAPRLVATALTGRGGYDPGVPGPVLDRPLRKEEAAMLEAALAGSGLTVVSSVANRRPVLKECGIADPLGTDGAEWVLEAVDAKGYRFDKAWSPRIGKVRDIGLAMLKLTGWSIDPVY